MSITFSCPKCSRQLRVEDRHAGGQAACPGCRSVVRIPDGEAPALVEPDEPDVARGIQASRPTPSAAKEPTRPRCSKCGNRRRA